MWIKLLSYAVISAWYNFWGEDKVFGKGCRVIEKTRLLYVVSTPIGNLNDITLRALQVLGEVDLIAAEDTRQTRKLLDHYGIKTPITSYHDHNKEQKTPVLLKHLEGGMDVALVSDAGTPGISDPGYYLIRRAIEQGVQVIPVPGPTASVAALVVSGLPTDRFIFEGFLPAKKGKRRRILSELATEERTIILYESPYRLQRTLNDILEVFGDRKMVAARELTKKFEEVIRGSVSELLDHFTQNRPRGEFVLVIEGHSED